MFPRPVVQFLFRIKAPYITPMCLVSSEALTNPNTTIYILRKTNDGAFICLCSCLSVYISLFRPLSIFRPFTQTQYVNIECIFMSKDIRSLLLSTKRNCCRDVLASFIKNMKPDTEKRDIPSYNCKLLSLCQTELCEICLIKIIRHTIH